MMKILLNSKKHKRSINVDNQVNLELSTDRRVLPSNEAHGTINEYQQYIKEKDNSQKYRLIFTINSFCSNVLFNAVSEIMTDEGTTGCTVYGSTGTTLSGNAEEYAKYKGYSSSQPKLTRVDAIRDTAYSHPEIGNLTYHCGYDIFNNHFLRSKEFHVTTPMDDNIRGENKQRFNTFKDFIRDNEGKPILKINDKIKVGNSNKPEENVLDTRSFWPWAYVYNKGNFMTFAESIEHNLIEENGWVGFLNTTALSLSNYKNIIINKCLNGNKANEMIDMYPDRSLYSFVPKINKFYGRTEPNWDYCLTYPYRSTTFGNVTDLLEHRSLHIKGIKAKTINVVMNSSLETDSNDFSVLFKTNIRHNLNRKSYIKLTIIGKKDKNSNELSYYTIDNNISVNSIGHNGEDAEHYFSVYASDLEPYTSLFEEIEEYRICRMHNSVPCEYYFRFFKRIPNFNGTNVYLDGKISREEIDEYAKRDFNSSLNKLAFGTNVFSDPTVQIVFNDDIDLTGLKDNLGRQVSEVYLTIVKRNKGHEEWYNKKKYITNGKGDDTDIEFSHCFSKVTSGIDIPYDYYTDSVERENNIHTIHNIISGTSDNIVDYDNGIFTIPKAEAPLEDNITVTGYTIDDNGTSYNEFLGDIVELIPSRLEEITLEKIYHRFNTAQRECTDNEYSGITDDEILYDMEDISGKTINDNNFEISSSEYSQITVNGEPKKYRINLMPEGYYYQPHYKIKLREYDDTIYMGSHIRIVFKTNGENVILEQDDNSYTGVTATNYYFEMGDTLYFENIDNDERIEGWVTNVDDNNHTLICFQLSKPINVSDIKNYRIFRKNPICPENAYDIKEGRYIWRNVKSTSDIDVDNELYNSTFTNGAHYIHKNINFYLKRQDPLGIYGLSYNGNDNIPQKVQKMVVDGKYKDVSVAEYQEENTDGLCSNI